MNINILAKENRVLVSSIFALAIPSMFSMLFETAYDIVNMAWVSRISIDAVAAVTRFATVCMVLNRINDVLGTGSFSLISRSYGSGNEEQTAKIIEQTIIFKIILSLIFGAIVGLVIQTILRPIASNANVLSLSVEYGMIRLLTLPLVFSSMTVTTALRCLGDAKKLLLITMFSSFANILLDPIFIFKTIPFIGLPGLGMGISGAAWATVICQTASFFIGLYILFAGKTKVKVNFKNGFKIDWTICKKLLTVGWPAGIDGLLRNASNYVVLAYLVSYGVDVVAAFGIGIRVMMLVLMPVFGLEMGSGVIIGQKLGSGNKKDAEKVPYMTALMELAIMICVGVVMFVFPKELMRFFTQDKDVILQGSYFFKVFAFSGLFAMPAYGMMSGFFGAGHNKPALFANIISVWFVQIPLMYIFSSVLHLGILWFWASMGIGNFVLFFVVLYNIRKNDWLTYNVL